MSHCWLRFRRVLVGQLHGRPLEGEFLRSAQIVNTMIQQLGVFTSEVTREVGTITTVSQIVAMRLKSRARRARSVLGQQLTDNPDGNLTARSNTHARFTAREPTCST